MGPGQAPPLPPQQVGGMYDPRTSMPIGGDGAPPLPYGDGGPQPPLPPQPYGMPPMHKLGGGGGGMNVDPSMMPPHHLSAYGGGLGPGGAGMGMGSPSGPPPPPPPPPPPLPGMYGGGGAMNGVPMPGVD
jgi:hypothetical protein